MFKKLGLVEFTIVFFFSTVGLIGVLFFYLNLVKLGIKKKYSYLFIFLPGLHIWTSLPGKDVLIFTSLSIFFYCMMNSRKFLCFLLIIFTFLIRPITGTIFFLAFFLNEFFKLPINLKLFILSFLILVIFLFQESVGPYFHYDSLSILFKKYIYKYEYTTLHYLPSNIISNIFAYVIVPLDILLIEKKSFYLLFLLINELFLIFLLIFLLKKINNPVYFSRDTFIFCILVCVIYLSIYPNFLFNFGIVIRQKWQIIPFLIYLIIFLKSLSLKRKLHK